MQIRTQSIRMRETSLTRLVFVTTGLFTPAASWMQSVGVLPCAFKRLQCLHDMPFRRTSAAAARGCYVPRTTDKLLRNVPQGLAHLRGLAMPVQASACAEAPGAAGSWCGRYLLDCEPEYHAQCSRRSLRCCRARRLRRRSAGTCMWAHLMAAAVLMG